MCIQEVLTFHDFDKSTIFFHDMPETVQDHEFSADSTISERKFVWH